MTLDFMLSQSDADVVVTFCYMDGPQSAKLSCEDPISIQEALRENVRTLKNTEDRELGESVMICAALYQIMYNGGNGTVVGYPRHPKIQTQLIQTELSFATQFGMESPQNALRDAWQLELNVGRKYNALIL